jgi:hypothetical protein
MTVIHSEKYKKFFVLKQLMEHIGNDKIKEIWVESDHGVSTTVVKKVSLTIKSLWNHFSFPFTSIIMSIAISGKMYFILVTQQTGNIREFPKLGKGMYGKTVDNILLEGKRLNTFTLTSRIRQG